ncbi:MAG TPA: hypothetical protein VEH02_00850 [Pseudolabrys sp.]|nr:hypothetical protein [Pseudolabrys sp.]
MNASIFDTRNLVSAVRVIVFAAAALAIAACQTDSGNPVAGDAPKAEVAAPKPESAGTKPQAAKPAEPADEAEPMTGTRAARECWMKTEKANPRENLDKRADIVNKCIEDKMKAAAAPPPKT